MDINFFFFNKFVKYITKGVLPEPPVFKLPTQITGIPTLLVFFIFLITLKITKYKTLNGNRIKMVIFSIKLFFFRQKLG